MVVFHEKLYFMHSTKGDFLRLLVNCVQILFRLGNTIEVKSDVNENNRQGKREKSEILCLPFLHNP